MESLEFGGSFLELNTADAARIVGTCRTHGDAGTDKTRRASHRMKEEVENGSRPRLTRERSPSSS